MEDVEGILQDETKISMFQDETKISIFHFRDLIKFQAYYVYHSLTSI